jgi:AraC family transcriptional regulator, transcriptional activator of pobA
LGNIRIHSLILILLRLLPSAENIAMTFDPKKLLQSSPGQCNVMRYATIDNKSVLPYSRRDYYKIWIVEGEGKLHYANKSIHFTQPALIFSNPLVPYAFERLSEHMSGYIFIFTESFFKADGQQSSILQSPLFQVGSNAVFFLEDAQLQTISGIYEKMLAEMESPYVYKYDLIRNYGNIIIHEALKMEPALSAFKQHSASTRIANLFLELLERQFPIDNPHRVLQLKKPADFAYHLSVHINHLNHAVRTETGKPTSAHIAARVVHEASALLKNTDWSVSDIAYSLGFDYPTYFNNFFKKNTGITPLSLRK